MKAKTSIALKKKLASQIQYEINTGRMQNVNFHVLAVEHLRDEIERQEEKAMKENLRKMEEKKKQALDKKKPFDLMTEKRPLEKKIHKNAHPVIGNVKIRLGPHNVGTICVREGYDEDQLAENFITSYNVNVKHKDAIILKIREVMKKNEINKSSKAPPPQTYHQAPDLSHQMSVENISPTAPNPDYFNIPTSSTHFQNPSQLPIQFPSNPLITENSNPNSHPSLMSPHFRAHSSSNSKPQSHPYNDTLNIQNDKIEFVGFSPQTEQSMHNKQANSSFKASLASEGNGSKRGSSKQSK